MLALAVPAFAVHTSTADLSPEWTVPSVNTDYTVTITNNGPDAVDEVRIYKNAGYTDFECDEKTGWEMNFITSKQACHYIAETTGAQITEGNSDTFTFSAKAPNSGCELTWKFETRDITETWLTVYDTTSIDETAPTTTKKISDPKKIFGDVEWVDTVTEITLDAVDGATNCAIGVKETKYLNILAESEEPCLTKSVCDNLSEPEVSPEEWKTYDGTPITKDTESCHILYYYSVDKLGNPEDVKTNCFFVDKTPPIVSQSPGAVNIPVDDEFDWWVTQTTPVNLHCEDTGPHPSGDVTMYWSYTVDGGNEVTGSYVGEDTAIYFPEDSVHTLELWCEDAVEKKSLHDIKTYRVDGTPPEIEKTMIGKDHLGECPPGSSPTEPCYVRDNGENGVHIDVADPDPTSKGCNVDRSACTYELWWKGEVIGRGKFGETGADIIFTEDSEHTLKVSCEDALGNAMPEDTEVFAVDSKAPVTTKAYGSPAVTNYGYRWITTGTEITLEAKDEKVGVDKIYYKTMLLEIPDKECYEECAILNNIRDGMQEYAGAFRIPEESCHLIEFYSVDRLGNEEKVNSQCVLVDDTQPVVDKQVGDPKVVVGDRTYITQQTPITLSCTDQQPHPVDNVSIKYRYRVSDDCVNWGGWTEWNDPTGGTVQKEIRFTGDSCHELKYYCEDALGNKTQTYSEIDIVDTEGPEISKEIVGPKYGDCPPRPDTDDKCYIDGVTIISVTATDPGPHPVGQATCEWSYTLDALDVIFGPYTTFPIQFPEETMHNLTIKCQDALGNTTYDRETFHVDKTPPETTKTYGQPSYSNQNGEWINSTTPITLAVEDSGQHKSGIKETKYRVTKVDDLYCNKLLGTYCAAAGSGDWQAYTTAFSIAEQSCHKIEYYSVDNVDKKEETKYQCVYVDNTAPTPEKTVGEPRTPWDGKGSIFYDLDQFCSEPGRCWKVTLLTPIKLDCVDPLPHPVDNEKVCFYVEVDADNNTEGYCSRMQGTMNEGYCCLNSTTDQFYFTEETEHNLKYYCEDALGNKGSIDDEKFKVEGTAFKIKLNKKWNLISVPFTLIDSDISTVLKDIDENVESVWTYDAFTDKWFVYRPGNPATSNLETMDPGSGYWVAMFKNDMLTIGGSLFSPITTPPSMDLKEGWNLVGYYGTKGILTYEGPKGNGKIARCALYSLGETELDKGWTALFTFWEPDSQPWKELGYWSKMDPGAGYWISLPENGLYSYSTTCGFVYDP